MSDSSPSRKQPSAHEALSKMVEWCDRNDWGSVPAKLEALCRNALLSEKTPIDMAAIAWAYRKLQTFGVHQGTMDSSLMMDRLKLILQEAE